MKFEVYKKFVVACIMGMIILILYACINYEEKNDGLLDFSAEQLIECYVETLSEQDCSKRELLISENLKAITANYDAICHAEIISVIPTNSMEISDKIEKLYETKIYNVDLFIDIEEGDGYITHRKVTWCFYLGKETDKSRWLIYDIK